MLNVPNDVIRLFLARITEKTLYAFSLAQRRSSRVITTRIGRIAITPIPRYSEQVSTYFDTIIDINRLPGDHGYTYACEQAHILIN